MHIRVLLGLLVGTGLMFVALGCDADPASHIRSIFAEQERKAAEAEVTKLHQYKAVSSMDTEEVHRRTQIARVDLRSIAVAIEAYHVDWNFYPPDRDPQNPLLTELTTPVAYLTRLPEDAFAGLGERSFRYRLGEQAQSWILWGVGPDQKYDLTDSEVAAILSIIPDTAGHAQDGAADAGTTGTFPMASNPPRLVDLAYDPSNGIVSDGDIWRLGPEARHLLLSD